MATKTLAQAKAEAAAAKAAQDKIIAQQVAAANAAKAKQQAETAAAKKAAAKIKADAEAATAKAARDAADAAAKAASDAAANKIANEKAAADAAAAKTAADAKAVADAQAAAAARAVADAKAAADAKSAADARAAAAARAVEDAKTAAAAIAAAKAKAEADAAAKEAAAAKVRADAEAAAQAKIAADKLAANLPAINQARSDFVKAVNANTVTQDQVDQYQAQVKELGGSPDSALLSMASNRLQQQTQSKTQTDIQAQKSAAEQAAFKLPDAAASTETTITSPNGTEYVKAPANPLTGMPAQWYQATKGASGFYESYKPANQPDAAPISANDFQSQQVQIGRDAQTYQQQQAALDQEQQLSQRRSESEQQQSQQAQAQAQQQLNNQYIDKLGNATTQAEFDTIKSQATAAGADVSRLQDYLQSGLQQKLSNATAAQQTVLNKQYTDQLAGATTQAELDNLLASAQQAGATINPGYVEQAQKFVNQQQQQVAAQTQTAAQASADTKSFVNNLPAPGSDSFNYNAVNQNELTAPDGTVYRAMPANPATGELGGWYVSQDQGASYSNLSGDNTAPVIPVNEFNKQIQVNNEFANQQAQQQRQTQQQQQLDAQAQQQLANQYTQQLAQVTTQSEIDDIIGSARGAGIDLNPGYLDQAKKFVNYKESQLAQAAQTAAETKSAADIFQSNLPAPGSEKFNYNAANQYDVTGPDGQLYRAVPAGPGTGEARWVVSGDQGKTYTNVGGSGPVIPGQQITQGIEGNFAAINQQAQQQRAQYNQQQAEDLAGPGMEDFLKVLAVMAIGSAVMGAISGAGAVAGGEAALAGSTAGEAAAAAAGMAESGLTATEIAAALEAEGIGAAAAQAAAETATGIASGTLDAATIVAESGFSPEALTAAAESSNPLAAINETITTVAGSGPVAPLYELSAAETAELMKNIDPNMIGNFVAPGTAGTAGGTAGSIFSGSSINPITNALVNAGITDPMVLGALTGALTSTGINLVTGQPITGKGLLTSALGGGVAGGIGAAMPDFGGGALGGAIGGAATNLGATAVVSLVTGQPITAGSLAGAALIGGAIGGAVGAFTDGAGNTTYQYDDGSSMTVSRTGTPVSVTDNTGASVPVGAVDRLTGEPKPMAPVEDRVPTPVAPGAPPAGTIPVQAADGTILYTDGQTYYTADGTVTDISNPTPGGATQEALLSPGSQQIVNDAGRDFAAGTKTWEETSARVNQAVRDDINSGYLKPTGNGTYIAPDGTEYFFNAESGMYDARVGVPGGTGVQGGTAVDTDQPPVVAPPSDTITQPVDRPPVAPPVAPTLPPTEPVVAPPTDTITTLPTEPVVTPPVAPPVAPTLPPTEPVVAPPVVAPTLPPTEPIVAPPVVAPTEPVAPPVLPTIPPTEPIVTPPEVPGTGTTPGPGPGPGTGGPGTGTGPGGPGLTPGPVVPPDVVAPPPDVVAPPPAPPPAPPVAPPPDVVAPPPDVVAPPPDVVAPPLEPLPPGEPAPPPVPPGPDITPPDVTPPVVEPPYVPPTYPPIYVPPIEPPVAPPKKVYDPLPPTNFGDFGALVNPGLNPGYITNVPRAYAPSGVRSQFYYGQHPYQPGPTFNRSLYNQTPAAPAQPWGLQQMYNPQTETIQNLLKGVQQASTRAPYNIPRAPKV